MCAKSCGSASGVSGEGEFLHELEERMEVRESEREISIFSFFSFFPQVARIQLSILQGIQCLHHSQHTENAMSELNSKLMDVSEVRSSNRSIYRTLLYDVVVTIYSCMETMLTLLTSRNVN